MEQLDLHGGFYQKIYYLLHQKYVNYQEAHIDVLLMKRIKC
jgi:hypothetical protein